MTFHRLPVLRARQIIHVLERAGFVRDRQKGSHLIMYNPRTKARTVVPVHAGETTHKALLVDIIRQSELEFDQFLDLL